MKRRSKAGGKNGKAGRRKAAMPKRRRYRPKAVPGPRSTVTTQETETARLTRERDEALGREKAAAEVLRVISASPGELEPVFQAMLENATRICEAKFGTLYRFADGKFHLAAQFGTGLRLSTPQLRDGIIEREIDAGLRWQDHTGKWRSRVYAGAADTMIFNLKPGASGDAPVGSIAEDFEEPTTINGVRFAGIRWLAADKSPGSRVQGWQAIRSRLNAAVPSANGAREKAGLFVCEGVRSFFDYVIVLPRDLKNNKEDIPDKLNDHTADCIRYRLRHNTAPTVSFRRRWIA